MRLILQLLFKVVLKVLLTDNARQRSKAQTILEGKGIIISFPSNSVLHSENYLPPPHTVEIDHQIQQTCRKQMVT